MSELRSLNCSQSAEFWCPVIYRTYLGAVLPPRRAATAWLRCSYALQRYLLLTAIHVRLERPVVSRQSPNRARMLRELGTNIERWRKLQGLSAARLAERAHVTRDTLRALETGTGSPRLDSVFAVLTALGIVNTVIASTDPWNSNAGRALMDEAVGVKSQSH